MTGMLTLPWAALSMFNFVSCVIASVFGIAAAWSHDGSSDN